MSSEQNLPRSEPSNADRATLRNKILDCSIIHRFVACRQGGAMLFLLLFIVVSFVARVALLLKSASVVDWNGSLLGAFALGFVFDVGMGLSFAAFIALVLALLPRRFFEWRWARGLAWVAVTAIIGALAFGVIAEWVFWDEFGVRFNFIAVDYLIYTKEVVGNIRESYPMPLIFAGLAAVSAVLALLVAKTGLVQLWLNAPASSHARRWLNVAGWVVAAAIALVALDARRTPAFTNAYNAELARNGLWSLFAAFRNNELDYGQFYAKLPDDEAFRVLHEELAQDGSTSLALRDAADARNTLRLVSNMDDVDELHLNVIQITVESLSAEFLGTFNNKAGTTATLTPNLDTLAPQSLVFENFYATGNRTDRGMEALSLSMPPTPGRSLIKRPANGGLFTLGSLFRNRGYDTAFIYGGYGYFDNMNAFFGGNGYRVIDRASVAKSDVTFANVWGACDGDLFRWTLREADASAASGKPFHYFVMTTSNHRPYTYPDGCIDLPPKISGRDGAVKYTDYAIGEFIREASKRPWFKNTIFVIVADHCAGSAGKTALPVENYHIPLILYAPGGQIAPGRVTQLASQIDYAPTLLGLLHWSYATRFYGWNVLTSKGDQRALIGNYQKLGLYEPGVLAVLSPLCGVAEYDYDVQTNALTVRPVAESLRDETIAYYQTAAYLYSHGRYRALPDAEQKRFSEEARQNGRTLAQRLTHAGN